MFTSEDPAEDDINLFRYVRNNPLNEADPSGLLQQETETIGPAGQSYGDNARGAHQVLPWLGTPGQLVNEALETLEGRELSEQINQRESGIDRLLQQSALARQILANLSLVIVIAKILSGNASRKEIEQLIEGMLLDYGFERLEDLAEHFAGEQQAIEDELDSPGGVTGLPRTNGKIPGNPGNTQTARTPHIAALVNSTLPRIQHIERSQVRQIRNL